MYLLVEENSRDEHYSRGMNSRRDSLAESDKPTLRRHRSYVGIRKRYLSVGKPGLVNCRHLK